MSEITVSPFLRAILQRLKSLQLQEAVDDNASNVKLPRVSVQIAKPLEGLAEVIDDAEEKATRSEPAMFWLRRLQDLLFEVDDLIDEVELAFQPHLQRSVSICLPRFHPFSKESRIVQRLLHIRRALEAMAEDARRFNFRSFGKHTSVSQGTTSHPYVGRRPHIIGRDLEKQRIMHLILNAAEDSASVAAIVGMGGMGKTSLVGLIYNDPSVYSAFDIRLWVDVGQEGTIDASIYQMGMQSMEQNYLHFDADFMSLEEMKKELYDLLSKTRFLLVLDDLWSAEFSHYLVGEVTDIGCRGSAVILTSRMREVGYRANRDPYTHELSPLSFEDSYRILTEYAFASNGIEIQPEFVAIAKQIVNLCHGIPLFLKVIGTYLYNKDTLQQWAEVLDASQGNDDFYGFPQILKFIVEKIPSYLKLPFYTFTLQEDSSAEELICLWMALGFLYSDDPNQQPEDIGRRYLKELAAGSVLCPDVEYAPGGVVRDIKLHDVVHDMATMKASEQGFRRCHGSSGEIVKYPRYLICGEDYVKEMVFKNAHRPTDTHLLMFFPGEQVSAQSVRYIVSCLECLRVLGLGGCDIEMLPDSVGHLKHLRYLDVGRNVRMRRLPESICDLWFLQTLLLHGCDQLEELPVNIGRLQNLRYLTLTTLQESLPEVLGQLTSLRTLGLVSCRRLAFLPCSIKNLKNLQTLAIADCQEMDLGASSSVEGLRGMDGIDTLLLAGLPKFECLPLDLGTPGVVMKHLLIQSCQKLAETAWINQFRILRSLTIEGCPELSALAMDPTSQFNNLAELVIRDCPSLGNTTWIRQFKSLRSLIIDGCRNLVDLDAGFSELKKLEWLEISGCPHLTERCASPGGEDWPLIAHVPLIELDGKSLKS